MKSLDEMVNNLKNISKDTAEKVIKASNKTIEKIEEVTNQFKVKNTIDTQRIVNDYIKDLRFSRFKHIYEAIGEAPKAEQVLLKSLFLKGLLTHNKALLEEIIRRVGLLPYRDDLEMLGAFSKDRNQPLSSELLEFVQKMLATESEKPLLSILMNAFQSIPELSLDSNTGTLSMKTKKALLPLLIAKVDTSTAGSIKSQLTDISFDALLPAFRPSIGDISYMKTCINTKKYLSLIGNKTDISEFLLLTIGFFTSQNIGDEKFLQELSANYLFVKYDVCLEKIMKKLSEKPIIAQLGALGVQKIIQASQNLKPFNSKQNDPRRFFETRLAQYINGLSHSEITLDTRASNTEMEPEDEELRENTLKACNKILQFFLGMNGKVDNPREMEQKISIFANGYKDTTKFSTIEIEFITGVLHHAEAHKGRDRLALDASTKVKERKFETDAEKVGSDVWNSSGGVMRGCSSVFYDAQREPMRNMLVDASTVESDKKDGKQWFWNKNRQYSAYVGSISGHTCNIVGMLAKYMKHHAQDPGLQNDVNLFLVQTVGVYAKRGFHAMLEVIDVLHDPYVQKIFEQYGIKIDLYAYFKDNPESAGFLRYAMNDAATYTQVLVNKTHIKEALESHSLFNKRDRESSNGENSDALTSQDGCHYV
ncbi:Dot/Icm secretion system substrate [Legionella lansingensis]|uniref:Substrate of the Dot/Icm secretion system n=1 Tax=Legionella lansingensis TaxID=45067 RepID=A0A0W0VUB9_9GAMM|nr:Dot/Icm T4SS effector Ceg14/sidL [Legionella lansingensis]KTD23824.1 substrate of the Dot/Icm secretion system [Legionella lansingensis]SNV46832.1 Dot/Icm secretion system substrate [Legionella lansingensis]